jgi:hypothetical protein
MISQLLLRPRDYRFWHFIGDAMRAFTFLELFLLLTLLRYRLPEIDPVPG